MPRIKRQSLSDVLQNAKDTINQEMNSSSSNNIPDIITFCESPEYLGLKQVDQDGEVISDLYPMQKIILKIFYKGSPGNENLKLTDEEMEYCKKIGLGDGEHGDVLQKYETDGPFRNLILVWGRRSGKTFLFSIIALYEAMRLLESPGGDPYAIYRLKGGANISILTVASSSDQASYAFSETQEKLLQSKYFEGKYVSDGITADSIHLLTPKDKRDNEERKRSGKPLTKGSIVIEVGHSNSNALRGKSIFVLLFDEMAAYKSSSGPASDHRLYAALLPAVNTYVRTIPDLDENGKQKKDMFGKPMFVKKFDGKIICISSPMGKEGKLWDLYTESPHKSDSIACRLPTWHVNIAVTEEDLRTHSPLSPEQFRQEYGAEFSGTAGENFFPRECVEQIFKNGRASKFRNIGEAGNIYFAHLDPASTSHNYALAVVHRELYYNPETKETDFKIFVDHLKYWRPDIGKPIQVSEVDNYLIDLKNKFFLAKVTYDQFNSAESIAKLKKHGIPAQLKRFNHRYIMTIYDELYNLVIGGRLVIPYDELLMNEMLGLQRKLTQQGYRKVPSVDGPAPTDDCVDAVAGACYNAIDTMVNNRLPNSAVVNTGASPLNGSRMWQSMSGPIGYGTGQQISQKLESINSWPSWKRR